MELGRLECDDAEHHRPDVGGLLPRTERAAGFWFSTASRKSGRSPRPNSSFPPTQAGQKLAAVDIKPEQHFTKPPARYTEASLVKALEKEGIGRPSTYATIISTIQDRRYVEQRDKKFYATDLGEVVTDKLNEYFPRIMDIAFTRYMEEQLDKIEEQHLDWLGVLRDFYGPFKENLETAQTGNETRQGGNHPQRIQMPAVRQAARLQIRQERQIPELLSVPGVQIRLSLRQGRQDDRRKGQRT